MTLARIDDIANIILAIAQATSSCICLRFIVESGYKPVALFVRHDKNISDSPSDPILLSGITFYYFATKNPVRRVCYIPGWLLQKQRYILDIFVKCLSMDANLLRQSNRANVLRYVSPFTPVISDGIHIELMVR